MGKGLNKAAQRKRNINVNKHEKKHSAIHNRNTQIK